MVVEINRKYAIKLEVIFYEYIFLTYKIIHTLKQDFEIG